ncbi:hypothetical protein GUITHDRAFT_146000 [Guillardia theta CCMP2712]|uniref:Uncharacterized protein n=1 Tax=Guillardia theta (strain CCMP2712) TaxID=905079 RepID=L1IJU1_GUITC|nr:hypothetical protein GUITHDRAFT_146000 [Guillardia theta CCMP2712]EKX36194.1 hypothetical protein GUITHDRAFT_146000 [Guillardia theta CCMP2712]|eukprot:XP_005823174.1 hypothetical protein GUITHDRAFT_146000 [Guillardia theta CCMP2712]
MLRWSELNAAVEKAMDPNGEGGEIPEGMNISDMMQEWLTQTDPKEKATSEAVLNRMHAQGSVLARMAYLALEVDARKVQDVVPGCKELELSEEPVDAMGWKELSQAMDNVQINWGKVSSLPGVKDLCWKLFARFGYFAGYAFGDGEDGIDIVHDREPCADGHRLSDLAKQQALDAFFCMFRYLWLVARQQPVQEQGPELDLRTFHFEAATDTYHETTMHDDVHIGALLQYMHRFSGLFHSVSQAVYYHHPTYSRRRAPMSMGALSEEGRSAADWIPVLRQLYPQLQLFYESCDLRTLPPDGWCWLHAPGRVWLVGPHTAVHWDPSPVKLLGVYLRANPGT